MRGYMAFLKKEWMEAVRTYKVFLMIVIFLLVGVMNPVTAKLLPVILTDFMPEGMTIHLQTVGAMDSWEQFYKNVPQIGLIIVVILFSGMLAGEFSKGTLIPMLAKGLSRNSVIFAKYTLSVMLWTISYVMCAIVSFVYTVYFWPKDKIPHILASLCMVWVFGLFLLAILLLFGVLTKRMAGALLGTGGIVVILFILQLIPDTGAYNPISLCSDNMLLLKGLKEPIEYLPAVIISVLASAACLLMSCKIFEKQSV